MVSFVTLLELQMSYRAFRHCAGRKGPDALVSSILMPELSLPAELVEQLFLLCYFRRDNHEFLEVTRAAEVLQSCLAQQSIGHH
eukprot:5288456-Pyramimonas_sp.AAC.1